MTERRTPRLLARSRLSNRTLRAPCILVLIYTYTDIYSSGERFQEYAHRGGIEWHRHIHTFHEVKRKCAIVETSKL